eukprot:gene15589-21688_t
MADSATLSATNLKAVVPNARPDLMDFIEYEDGTVLWNCTLVLLNYIEKTWPEGVKFKEKQRQVEAAGGPKADPSSSIEFKEKQQQVEAAGGPKADSSGIIKFKEKQRQVEAAGGPKADPSGTIEVAELAWGEAGWRQSPLSKPDQPSFDYVIACELVYNTSSHDDLLWSLKELTHPKTTVFSCWCNRPFSFMFLAKLHDMEFFDLKVIDEFDHLGMEVDHVHLHLITQLNKDA